MEPQKKQVLSFKFEPEIVNIIDNRRKTEYKTRTQYIKDLILRDYKSIEGYEGNSIRNIPRWEGGGNDV